MVAVVLAVGALAATPLQDPYSIFARARAVWTAQHYPAYLSYTIAVHVTEHGVDKSKHYHLTYDAQNDAIDVNAVSDEEHAAPPVPSGFFWHLQPRRQGHVLFDKKVGNPGDAVDYLGVPKLAPTYSFGMKAHAGTENGRNDDALVAQIRQEFNDPMPPAKNDELASHGKLKSIASVTSRARAYTIRLTGTEPLGGRDCYHLLLQPNGDPRDLRLREAWIDTQTFETRQLLSAGNFTGSTVPWLITFEDVGGALYISSEVAQAPVGVGEHRYERASISFESISQTGRPARMGNGIFTSKDIMTEPVDGDGGTHQRE
jgi:hypothetical protein